MQRINLIPPEFAVGQKALIETGVRRRAILIGILLVTATSAHYTYTRFAYLNADRETSVLEAKIAEAKALSEAIDTSKESTTLQIQNLEKKNNALMGRQVLLQRLNEKNFKWSEALSEFQKSIPGEVWVDDLTLEERLCKVKGGTYSNETVGAFINGLNESEYFANAVFVKTEAGTINEKPVVLYELNFELVRSKKL